jgi:hypothetical protein
MGRFSAMFTRTFADVLMRAYVAPVTEVRQVGGVTAAAGAFDTLHAPAGVNIANGTIIYCEREAMKVTGTGAVTVTVTRGWADSTAEPHPDGADIFLIPPTWAGRAVDLYEVDRVGSGAGSESLLRHGYMSGEPAQGIHWPIISVTDQFFRARLNAENESYFTLTAQRTIEGSEIRAALLVDFRTVDPAPRYNDDGGYWWVPKAKVCVKGTYDSTYGWRIQTDPLVVGEWPSFDTGQSESWRAYEMAYSSNDGTHGTYSFTPFGYDNGADQQSTNPAVIALNLLLSTEAGGNTPGGGANDYDRGDKLGPDLALGVDYSLVDIDDFETAWAELAGVEARRLWLGGTKPELLSDVFKRLLAPWGYSVGLTRQGVWRLLRVSDVYGVDTKLAITSDHIVRVGEVTHQIAGRSLDSVIIEADPWPDGSSVQTAFIRDYDGRRLYPQGHGVQVGAEQVFKQTPYDSRDLVVNTGMYSHVASRMRILALRSFTVDVVVAPSLFGQLDIGDGVTIHEVVFVNPYTGERLTASDGSIKGLVIAVQDDYRTRQDKLTILLMPDDKVAAWAPAGKVDSYDAGTHTATLESAPVAPYTRDDDAAAFTEGDKVVLLNSRHVLLSDEGNDHPTYIKTIGVNTLQVSQTAGGAAAAFRDGAGNPLTPVADDVITYAHYDAVNAVQQANYAHGADDGAQPASPGLGAGDDDPYLYGR